MALLFEEESHLIKYFLERAYHGKVIEDDGE